MQARLRRVSAIAAFLGAALTSTEVFAQAPVNTGCTGSPVGTHGTNSAPGVLAIAMNSLALVDSGPDGVANTADDVEVTILSSPKDLNFAAPNGADVGEFVSGAQVPAGTYEGLAGVMDDTFRILCSVSCNGQTYVTKGGASSLAPDGVGGAAIQSDMDISGGMGPQAFTLGLFPPLTVAAGGSVQKNLGFSATGACELWDISGPLGNPPNTNFKIVPKPQAASAQ